MECLLTAVSIYFDVRVQTESSRSNEASGSSDRDLLCGSQPKPSINDKEAISKTADGDDRSDIGPSENSVTQDRTLVDIHDPPDIENPHHYKSTLSLD